MPGLPSRPPGAARKSNNEVSGTDGRVVPIACTRRMGVYAVIRRQSGVQEWHLDLWGGVAMEPRKKVSPVRTLIGLVVLIAVATVAAVELRAFYAANQAVKKLEKAQDQDQKDKSASTLTKERVQS